MRVAPPSLAACIAVLAAALPRPGASQSIPSPYAFVEERQEAGVIAGWMSARTGRFGFGPKEGAVLGVRYGIDLSGPLSLETSMAVMDGVRDVVTPARPEGDAVIGEADVLLTMIDLRLRLAATGARTWHGLSPFIVLGGGVTFDPRKNSAADVLLEPDERFQFGTKFLGTAGPGVRWSITRHLALRGDLALSIWQIQTPAGFGDPTLGLVNVAESEWVSSTQFTAGLLFRW